MNGFEVGTSRLLLRHLVFVDICSSHYVVALASEAWGDFLEKVVSALQELSTY